MNYIEVEGGHPLAGELAVQGSKNAALPMMAAALLTPGPVTLYGCPQIEDVDVMCQLLSHLGAQVSRRGDQIQIQAKRLRTRELPKDLVHRMRSSIMLMGPLLARTGGAELYFPGGCVIGARPIDLHLEGLSRLGYQIIEEADGHLHGFRGMESLEDPGVRRIHLRFPSVGATENILMGAALSTRPVILSGAAKEPEVCELARMLMQMGVKIEGMGSDQLIIQGARHLRGVTMRVMGDRIVTGTYLVAAAATGGHVSLTNVSPLDNGALFTALEQMGCRLVIHERQQRVELQAPETLRATEICTAPHPGFATDLQAITMVGMTQAEGVSRMEETIFENRFRHVEALRRMGARIQVSGGRATIYGKTQLKADELQATDLRAGAAMIIAALCAQGRSRIYHLEHVRRGYENIAADLGALGAVIITKD